jgi:DNA-binding response OmpR family regulator
MSTSETILIIEDDATMLRVLKDNLEYSGMTVKTASDGEAGLERAVDVRPDLILLDIMLPRINGYEVCRLLREEGVDTPIIMLTAKGQESDIVLGLNLGADDYVTKPFSMSELLARIKAMLRRKGREDSTVLRFREWELDRTAHRLMRDGREVKLTPKEFSLLRFFAEHEGRALTREEILRSVWGSGIHVNTRSVDRCVTTLREKIEREPHRPALIRTIRDIGYRFESTPDPGDDEEQSG